MKLTQTVDETTGGIINLRYESTYSQPDSIWGSTTPVRHFYGTQGQLDSTRVAGKITRYTYATRGRVKSITDPEGHGTFVTYGDEYGGNSWANTHLIEQGAVSSAYRRTTTFRYDNYGRVQMVRDPANDTTRTEYDLLNRPERRVNAQGHATTYRYGAIYLNRVTDAKNQTYHFIRNALGWLESEVDPRDQWMYYGFDRNGNQTSFQNRRQQIISAEYD